MMSHPDDELDERDLLDLMARTVHTSTSAQDAHWEIAIHLWPQLKALGYTSGHLLGVGIDTDLLSGRPPYPPRGPGHDLDYAAFHAPLPPAGQWPHLNLPLHPLDDDDGPAEPDLFDVVIANLPYTDTRFHSKANITDIATITHRCLSEALGNLRPGGILVALTHRQFLDGLDDLPRQAIARRADLLGAVRLPAGTLRQAPLSDSPVDLLLLRRRETGHEPGGASFTSRTHATFGPRDTWMNQYYASRPHQLIGSLGVDPADPTLTTTLRDAVVYPAVLRSALVTVLHDAQADGLDARIRPAPSAPAVRADPRDRPQGRSDPGPTPDVS